MVLDRKPADPLDTPGIPRPHAITGVPGPRAEEMHTYCCSEPENHDHPLVPSKAKACPCMFQYKMACVMPACLSVSWRAYVLAQENSLCDCQGFVRRLGKGHSYLANVGRSPTQYSLASAGRRSSMEEIQQLAQAWFQSFPATSPCCWVLFSSPHFGLQGFRAPIHPRSTRVPEVSQTLHPGGGEEEKNAWARGEMRDMPYDPLDDIPHSVRVNLSGNVQPMDDNDGHLHPRTPRRSGRNPYPLHFSPATDGSPDVHQHQHTSAPISSTWSIGHTAHPHNCYLISNRL